MQHSIGEIKIGPATPARPQRPSNQPHHHPHHLQPLLHLQISDDSTFNVLQFNANGIGNKLTELGVVLERNKVKVAVIQESKLTSKSKNPCIRNYTTVRKDRPHGHGGELLVFIHESITFSKQPSSPETLSDPHLEELTIKADIGNTKLIISNIYIPPASSCSNGYQSSIEHLLTTPDTLILGDFNAHHPSWYSRSTDTRGKRMDDSINGSNYGKLNWDSPTRVPPNAEPSSPDGSLASTSLITSCSWQTLSTLSSDHLPILIRLQMKTTSTPGLRRTYVNLKKANWDRYRQEVETALSKRSLPTDCQREEKIFRAVLLKAASHHIPTGRHRLHEEPVPAEILDVMTRRDDLRKRDPTSPELPRLNYDIQNRIYAHKSGGILLRPWTRRQMSPSCGELLKKLMAEQHARQRTKLLPSTESRSHRPSS